MKILFDMDATIRETDFKNVVGTSFHDDTINANVNELIQILGVKPIKYDNVDTMFNWCLEYHSKILNKSFLFTIYDYNENWDQHTRKYSDTSSRVNDYLYTTNINWHIGGLSADDTILVKIWLKNRLKELRK